MKVWIILMIIFSDGTPTLHTQVLTTDARDCVAKAWAMMVDSPQATFAGHPVKSWSATCLAEGIGAPT